MYEIAVDHFTAPPSLPYSHRKDNSISSEVGGESDSYLCMSPSSGITNSGFVRSGSTSSNQRPEKTQSFITTVQPPEPSPYLEMSPGAIANTNDTPYLDMKPTSLSISDSAYLDMAPIGSSKSDSGSIGRPASSAHPIPIAQASPYLDMAPQGSSLSSSPYMDMTPGRSIDNIMSSSFQGLSITGKPDGHQYVDMTGGGAHRTSAASIHGEINFCTPFFAAELGLSSQITSDKTYKSTAPLMWCLHPPYAHDPQFPVK